MIDPALVTTQRLGQLTSSPFNLTDLLAHEVGSDLNSGTVQEFADFLSAYIGASSGISFVAITVPDGGTLPSTSQSEWLLVGKGTFYNVGGGATIVTTEELNALVSNGTFWTIGVEIPIEADLIGITQTILSGNTQTAPSENAVFNALALKMDIGGLGSNDVVNDSNVDGTTLTDALNELDSRVEAIVQTTAGVFNRINFTGDTTTISAGTFYLTSATSKGTIASAIQSVVNGDNQKQYFSQDLIGNAFASMQKFPAGVYAGILACRISPNIAQQRYTVEIYKCNNGGTPIASGITGAPSGSLGVTVIAILDSGIINLADSAITGVPISGQLLSELTINTGERIRYHVSAEKVGTAGANITMEVLYGSNYNSYYDVPVTFTTDNIKNTSNVPGDTAKDALNNLNDSDIIITTSTSITTATLDSNGVGQSGKHVIIDNGVNVINITCNGGVVSSYGKTGTGAITFVQGSGRILVALNGAVFDGIAGSTASLWSNGTTDYLSIINY
jgi:hypothetical protein